MARWNEAIAVPWSIGLIVLLGLIICRHERKYILIFSFVWLFGQLVFPYAYAFQDYYFYAGAVFLVFVFGWVATGVLESGWLPKWARVVLALLPVAAMGYSYQGFYYNYQRVESDGGSAVTRILKEFLPRESVIVIIGQDWSAVVPYYSKHRALMIRKGLQHDAAYVREAIASLEDLEIAALIATDLALEQFEDVGRVVQLAGLVPEPVFKSQNSVVYINSLRRNIILEALSFEFNEYPELTLLPASGSASQGGRIFQLSRGSSEVAFPTVGLEVERYRSANGYSVFNTLSVPQFSFHSDSDLWLRTPDQVSAFRWKYGIFDGAWDRDGGRTDGVDFVIFAESEDGGRRELWRDQVTPAEVEANRGLQTGEGMLVLNPGEQLVFASRERNNGAFDWAYFTSIEVW